MKIRARNLKAIGILIGVLFLGFAAVIYFLVIDGDLPKQSTFNLDLMRLAEQANAPAQSRPYAIEVEIVARNDVPKFGVHAGLDRSPVTMARAVFRLKSDWGDTLIDVGMDAAIARKFNPTDVFNAAAADRVYAALGHAKRITVTHEHPDHLGLLGRYTDIDKIAPALRLNAAQLEGVAQYTDGYSVPPSIAALTPMSSKDISEIAPGVLMIPAPGHTPGTVLFYVRMQDDTEVLFLGDVVWNMSNIIDEGGRPRLVQQYLMPMREDRHAVYQQVAALVALRAQHPELIMIPSHDEDQINILIARGVVSAGFGPR